MGGLALVFSFTFTLIILPTLSLATITIGSVDENVCPQSSEVLSSEAQTLASENITTDSFCGPYDTGDELTVDGNEGTSLVSKYKIHSTGHNSFELGLNYQFQGDAKDVAEMNERVKDCLERFNTGPRMYIGPEKFKLHIDETAPVNVVKLTPGKVRSNTEDWGTDVGCPTILHETFHYLGLVDEYEETEHGPYPCRAIGPVTSLMNRDEMQRIENTPRMLDMCMCLKKVPMPPGQRVCDTPPEFNSLNEANMVALVTSYMENNTSDDPAKKALAKEQGEQICGGHGYMVLQAPFTFKSGQTPREFIKKSLPSEYYETVLINKSVEKINYFGRIYGGQLRTILYPGCRDKNQTYYSCAASAYSLGPKPSTYESIVQTIWGTANQATCPAKPEECNKPSWVEQ